MVEGIHWSEGHRHAYAYRGGVCVDTLSDRYNSLLKCVIIVLCVINKKEKYKC